MWWFHIKGWQHRPEAPASCPSGATENLDSRVAATRFGATKPSPPRLALKVLSGSVDQRISQPGHRFTLLVVCQGAKQQKRNVRGEQKCLWGWGVHGRDHIPRPWANIPCWLVIPDTDHSTVVRIPTYRRIAPGVVRYVLQICKHFGGEQNEPEFSICGACRAIYCPPRWASAASRIRSIVISRTAFWLARIWRVSRSAASLAMPLLKASRMAACST